MAANGGQMRRALTILSLLALIPGGASADVTASAGTRTAEHPDQTGHGTASARADADPAGAIVSWAQATGTLPVGSPVAATTGPMIGDSLAVATAWSARAVEATGPASFQITITIADIDAQTLRSEPSNIFRGGLATVTAAAEVRFACEAPSSECAIRAVAFGDQTERRTRTVSCSDGSCSPANRMHTILYFDIPEGFSGILQASGAIEALAYARGAGLSRATATAFVERLSIERV